MIFEIYNPLLRILIDTFILPNIEKNADKIADALYCVGKYLIFSDGLQVEGDVWVLVIVWYEVPVWVLCNQLQCEIVPNFANP